MPVKLKSKFSSYIRYTFVGVESCMLRPFGAPALAPKTQPGGIAFTFEVTNVDGTNPRQIVRETGSTYGQGAVTQIIDGLNGRPLTPDEVEALDIESFVGQTGLGMIATIADPETGLREETITGLEPDPKPKPATAKAKS